MVHIVVIAKWTNLPSKLHDLIYLGTYFFGVDPDPPLTLIYYLLPKTLMGRVMIRLPKTGLVFLEAFIIPSTKYNCIMSDLLKHLFILGHYTWTCSKVLMHVIS